MFGSLLDGLFKFEQPKPEPLEGLSPAQKAEIDAMHQRDAQRPPETNEEHLRKLQISTLRPVYEYKQYGQKPQGGDIIEGQYREVKP